MVEVFDRITEHLEDSRAATALTSIDYSKAFNRVEHLPLLEAFASKGAASFLLKILASFLIKRTMSVRLATSSSKPRYINAGAPQGSVLGTYIFNVATDMLEDDFEEEEEEHEDLREGDLAFLETAAEQVTAHSTPERQVNDLNLNISPIQNQGPDQDFIILRNARNVPTTLTRRIKPTWRSRPLGVRKYVDDNIQDEKFHMKRSKSFRQGTVIFKNPRLVRSEKLFKHITSKAKEKDLVMNAKKTNLLIISAARSYEARGHIYDEQNCRVDSTKTMKALGFLFNEKGDISSQIENLIRKFRTKVWALRELRKAGFSDRDLITTYKTYMRPTLEYSAQVLHPMLSSEQATEMERQQYFALKTFTALCIAMPKCFKCPVSPRWKKEDGWSYV